MELYRPKIQIPLTKTDKALEVISLLLLVILIGYAVTSYASSPDIIPIHFNTAGKVNGYGSRLNILAMAGVGTFIYLLLTIINRYPHQFNYIREIAPDNAASQYQRMTKLLRWMKVILLGVFLIISNMIISAAKNQAIKPNIMLFVAIIAVVSLPIFVAFYAGRQDKKLI